MVSRKKNTVLIADDQQEMRDLLGEKLRALGKDVTAFSSGTRLVQHLHQGEDGIELVVLDLDFGPGEPDGIEILQQVKEVRPELPVIILTGKGSIDAAVEAVQHGAADFIEKDLYVEDKLELGMEKVERMLQVLRENARLKAENEALGRENVFYRTELGQRYRIVSASPKIESLLEQVEQIASIPRPVLIRGERGTGKELIAAALHYGGARANRPFVKLNCAALSDTLLESELFGHEKGAFTGATEKRQGRFETADGGTLFLDEIGNTSIEFQKNVLRVIEYQEFERIGSTQTIRVDVRVVAATNADLEQEIEEGRFRADLYDRLRFSVLHLPPLRERVEDIHPLIEYFTQQLCDEVPSIVRRPFGDAARGAMETYPWLGNVRELKFAVERALCVALGDCVEPGDLPPEVLGEGEPTVSLGGDFDGQVTGFELGLLKRALGGAGGSQKEAAKALGLSYDRFRHLLRKHELIGK
ncbi:MAG: sigma-54-dependent Fis family transcriptional regulator [Gemmatimonadetes bacterium]|mgnify:CR=1 FL=1|jgi:two-component system, NtrC family, response regulator HydG|nr:sigma-54-dependent Fis family transcriptional regulator [Gemmatimonadota bacterium]